MFLRCPPVYGGTTSATIRWCNEASPEVLRKKHLFPKGLLKKKRKKKDENDDVCVLRNNNDNNEGGEDRGTEEEDEDDDESPESKQEREKLRRQQNNARERFAHTFLQIVSLSDKRFSLGAKKPI